MKKLLWLPFLLILLCSCTNVQPLNSAPYISNEQNTSYVLDKYMYMNLPQLNKKDQRIYYVEWGKLTDITSVNTVYILSDAQTDATIQTEVYMVADIQGELATHIIGTFDKMVIQNGTLALADIDGDGKDEIIIHFEITGNGATITQIYEVENQKIVLLSDLSDFDTGYTGSFQNGYKLQIKNSNTSSSFNLDISDMFTNDFFDENGVAITNEAIILSPFTSCYIADVNNDGIYELQCEQNVNLVSGFIGKAKTVLRYDAVEKQFKVIETVFTK